MARNGVSVGEALARGLRRRCPNCGKGHAFRGYLQVVDACAVCAEPLKDYPADDGPAYVTILLIGHIVIGPVFLFHWLYIYPPVVVLSVMIGAIVVLALAMLPIAKGAFLNLVWVMGLRRK